MDETARTDPKHTPRNLVICCDGTGNEISENISNVLKLYRCLRKTERTQPRQLVFYDPGVGTLAQPDTWHRIRADIDLVLGLATGYGRDDNVLSAYRFLVGHYAPDDRIYLFGFSRGTYAVRVLAGLLRLSASPPLAIQAHLRIRSKLLCQQRHTEIAAAKRARSCGVQRAQAIEQSRLEHFRF